MSVRLSYIIAVLDSHEVVRRQMIYWAKLDLPPEIEIILVDDGSDPPLSRIVVDPYPRNLTIHETHDTRPWTYALARNAGARIATGEYILNTDIDHILPHRTLMEALAFTGDRMLFSREFGVLDEQGNFSQDVPTLLSYGLLPEWIDAKKLKAPPHWDSYLIRRDLFWKAGGYRETDMGRHPPLGETHFREDYRALGKTTSNQRPMIYIIPNGYYCGDLDYNPFGMFHNLSRKSRRNAKLQREVEAKRRAMA